MEYRVITQLSRELFGSFIRRQEVNLCWRRGEDGQWVIREDPFIDDWTEADYEELIECLRNTIRTGGLVCGAFTPENVLKGFVSVESGFIGSRGQYMDLSSIHVSADMRGQGIGKTMFRIAADWAREHGARKLYISAHSAVESQAFYRGLGCTDAQEYNAEHVQKEPYDCQLEYELRREKEMLC